MQSTSRTRRALGLVAASTLGMSTAVLAVTGVAQAAPPVFSISGSGGPGPYTVPAGICAIQWYVTGGSGGDSDGSGPGSPGGELWLELPATEGDVFTLHPGTAGARSALGAGGAGGTSTYNDGGVDGAGGSPGDGGGGAASVVAKVDGSVYLGAFGGAGGGAGGGTGGGDTTNLAADAAAQTTDPDAAHYYDPAATSAELGDGTITGEGIPCAPAMPNTNYATGDDRSLMIHFDAGTGGNLATSGYEYTTDDGATFATLPVSTVSGWPVGTISGLTNGTEYTVRIRAVAASGETSAWSAPVTGTPYKPLPAPSNVVATAGPSSIKVTWDAPASGTVASYDVGWSGGQSGGLACAIPAGQPRVCVFPVPAGSNYTASVTAIDAAGFRGVRAEASPGAVPASSVPATVPTSNGDLERPAGETGSVTAGTKVTLSGSGYLPNSTITVAIYSEPQVLTTVVTDATGSFTVEVTVPDGLANGDHTLVASGVDSTGTLRYMTLPVTVVGGTTGEGGLAYTGADIAVPAIGGLVALTAGGGLLVVSRRRTAA